jgi:hypothetical protein
MIRRPKHSTRVLLLYDELDSGVYATEFFDQITKMLNEDMQLEFNIWNFESIHLTMLRESVFHSALDADIIAFAIQEDRPIAEWILEWSQSWLPFKKSNRAAFLGILINSDNWPSITPNSSNLKQLRKLANKGQLAFFTQKTFLTDPIAI